MIFEPPAAGCQPPVAITAEALKAFEAEVAAAFAAKTVRGPVHLSGGNEAQLIEVFRDVSPGDWVFSTYRSHYHALLHGVPREYVMAEILAGRSMTLASTEHRFFSSAIVGGCLPIATGVAAAIARDHGSRITDHGSRVWCFIGDMAARGGAFHEARQYAEGHDLPIVFVIEDNGLSCNSPTAHCWGESGAGGKVRAYAYVREWPHTGIREWVQF